tara:strand:- start:2433 stop:2642 length:210 start_codon:yes stop_codon:yes gene_type:complete
MFLPLKAILKFDGLKEISVNMHHSCEKSLVEAHSQLGLNINRLKDNTGLFALITLSKTQAAIKLIPTNR